MWDSPLVGTLKGRLRNLLPEKSPKWIALNNLSSSEEGDNKEENEGDDGNIVEKESPTNGVYNNRINAIVVLVSVILLTIGGVYYNKSLKGGPINWIHDNLPSLARWMLISVVCLYCGLFLLFLRRKNMKRVLWYPLMLVVLLVLWFGVIGRNLGASLENHGLYNLAMFGAIVLVLLFYTLLWVIAIKLLKSKLRAAILHLVLINALLLFVIINNVQFKADWPKGLPGKELQNNGIGCNIPTDFIPYPAYLPKGWSNILGQKCPSQKHFATLENDILTINCDGSNEATYIEHPNYLASRSDYDKDRHDLIRYYGTVEVQKEFNYSGPAVTYSELVEAKCGSDSQVFIRNRANSNVTERIKEKSSNYSSHNNTDFSHPPNILFIYIDALSRAHAHRRLPQTMKTLASFDAFGEHQVYEFFKYHALGPHTGPNTVPMYTGGRIPDWDYPTSPANYNNMRYGNEKDLWWRQFDEQYVKAWQYGTCEDWEGTYLVTDDLPYDMDHTVIMPFCNPQAFPDPNPFGPFAGPYGLRSRCIGDRRVHTYLLEYTKEYFTNYKEAGKIMSMTFLEAHEGSMEVVGQVDSDLSDFLMSDEIQSEMNNTFVFLVADHGNHMSPFFLWTKDGKVENRLPMLFMITPKWFKERYPEMAENLQTNQNRLVTSFDIYNAFMQLRMLPEFGQNVSRSAAPIGLFGKVSEERLCNDASINEEMCICNK